MALVCLVGWAGLPAQAQSDAVGKNRGFTYEFEVSGSASRTGAPETKRCFREHCVLEQSRESWRQVTGKEADPRRPELYPRVPKPRLVSSVSHRGELSLELSSRHGTRMLLEASLPGRLELLPGRALELSFQVNTGLSSAGLLEVEIQFLDREGRRAGYWRSKPYEVYSSGWEPATDRTEPSAPWKRVGPLRAVVSPGTRAASVRLRYRGDVSMRESRLVLDSLEVESVEVPRISWRGDEKASALFLEGDPLRARVTFPAPSGGPWSVDWQVLKAPAAGIPKEVRIRGKDTRWALPNRDLRHEIHNEDRLPPGAYELRVRCTGRGERSARQAELRSLFAVLPLSTQFPRSAWRRLERRIEGKVLAGSTVDDSRGLFLLFRDVRRPDVRELLVMGRGEEVEVELPFELEPQGIRLLPGPPVVPLVSSSGARNRVRVLLEPVLYSCRG